MSLSCVVTFENDFRISGYLGSPAATVSLQTRNHKLLKSSCNKSIALH